MSGSAPRVVVLYNAPLLPEDHPEFLCETEVVEVAETVAESLRLWGFEAIPLGARPPVSEVLMLLSNSGAEVVFNLIEGFDGTINGATYLTALLELIGHPYTGSPAEALALCQSKSRTKALLKGFGLPTAPYMVVGQDDPIPDWPGGWPVFVKPEGQDASVGIEDQTVTIDAAALRDRVIALRSRFGGSVLLESYLPGHEFNVGVLAVPNPVPLPVVQLCFDTMPGEWPILTYDAKWSIDWETEGSSPVRCPAQIDQTLADQLGELAVAAFRATGCRDYARVDFRLDDQGRPMILEVNPNPDLVPCGNWASALRASGRDYAETLAAITQTAWKRRLIGRETPKLKHA